jgi:hypothetical protein
MGATGFEPVKAEPADLQAIPDRSIHREMTGFINYQCAERSAAYLGLSSFSV